MSACSPSLQPLLERRKVIIQLFLSLLTSPNLIIHKLLVIPMKLDRKANILGYSNAQLS